MANISEWSTTAASNNSGSPNGFPENMAPSGVNDSAREVMAALAKWYNDTRGSVVSAGTKAAYTLTTNNAHAAISDVALTVFESHTACTASATLNVDSTGAKTIKKLHDQSLAANDIEAGQLCVVAYNSTDDVYELLAPAARQFATQAEAEGAAVTDVAPSPATMHYHPGVAKGWAAINSSGTTIAAYGASSVRNTTGDYTVTWATSFSSANYAVVVTPFDNANRISWRVNGRTATTTNILTVNQDGDAIDPPFGLSVVAFGDQ